MVCIIEDNFQIQAPGGLFSEGLIIGGIFAFQNWGTNIHGGAYFRNFMVFQYPRIIPVIVILL